jgi:hypothetical protein
MKALLLLIVLAATCQNLGQTSSTTGSPRPQEPHEGSELRESLGESARHLYGDGLSKTLVFTNRPSPPDAAESHAGLPPRSNESPFGGSDYEESTKDMSEKGDVASGVILREEKDVLYLDLTPCRPQSRVFTFHSPFVKKRLPSLDCRGKQIDRFLVAQR